MNSSNRTLRLIAVAAIVLGALLVASAVIAPRALAILECNADSGGANDVSGQRDLTKGCSDYTNYPTSLQVTWNWDVTGVSGANTADACSLFDTDNDGFANYAVCVTGSGTPLTGSNVRVLTCGNDKADRCTNSAAVPGPTTTSCTTAQTADDPFPAGDAYPNDTKATCDISLADVGGSAAVLLDVCSYPSASPNSAPADCVVRAASGNQLIVRKLTQPLVSSGHVFDFTINPGGLAFTLSGGGTHATSPDLANGTYTITEVRDAGETGWTTSISCDNGTTVPSDNNTVDVALSGSPVTCTFTNTASPISATLADFTATGQADRVLLAWETVSETNNVGFNIYRAESGNGARTQLNAALIPSANPGSAAGASYSYQDANVVSGASYYYWVEDVDTSGKATLHGPVSVELVGPTAIGLDSFSAAASSAPALLALGAAGLAALAGVTLARRKRA